MDYIQATCPLMRQDIRKVQSNTVNMEIEGVIESFHIKRVEFGENVRAFFPQGQSKLSVIMRCQLAYWAGVRRAGFDCNLPIIGWCWLVLY